MKIFSGEIKDHGKPIIIACFRTEFWKHDFLIRSSTFIHWNAQSMSAARNCYDPHFNIWAHFSYTIFSTVSRFPVTFTHVFCILVKSLIIRYEIVQLLSYLHLIMWCNRNHCSGTHVKKIILLVQHLVYHEM